MSRTVAWVLYSRLASLALGYYAADVLVNISLVLIDHRAFTCIKVIHKTNLSGGESQQIFHVFKALSMRTKESVGVYSYELYSKSAKEREHQRKNCPKPINYVIGEEDSRGEFSRLSRTLPMSDSFWLVALNSSVSDFFAEAKTSFNTEIIVAKIEDRPRIEFLEVYRVDDDYPMRIHAFGSRTPEGGLQLRQSHLYSRRFDLEGKLLVAGFIENWPMSSFKGDLWDGYFPRIWKELEKLINCTTKPLRSVDDSTGVLRTNGTWNGLIGMAVRKEVDVIVSEITMNDERYRVLKFSRPVLISNYQVFFCDLGNTLKWTAVLHPFSQGTWLAVCAWVTVGSFAISISFWCAFERNDEEGFTPVASFFFILQSLCQQGKCLMHVWSKYSGYPSIPRASPCKIVFVTSYLLSAVLIPSYSASLIYSLTHHAPNKPFDSLEEFLLKGRYELNVIRNSAQQVYFKRSVNGLDQLVYSKVRKNKYRVQSLKEGLERSLCTNDDQAFFGVQAIVEMYLQHSSLHKCCRIVTFAKPLSPVHQCLAFLKDSPYGDLINYKLQRLFTTGVIDNIQKHFQYEHQTISSYKEVEVGIEDVFQIFVLLVTGLALSVVFFVVERLHAADLLFTKKKKNAETLCRKIIS